MRPCALVPPLALPAVAALLLSGCGTAPATPAAAPSERFPVNVTTCDFTSEVRAEPRRIVTMNQGATEVALALGVADRMVGTAYLDDAVAPRFRADYERIPVLAAKYPTQETMLSVRPDLVYGSYNSAFSEKNAGDRARLQGQGIATLLAPAGCATKPARASWDLIWDELTAAGKAFGTEDAAAKLVAEQKNELGGTALKGAARGQRILWWDFGAQSGLNVGAGTGTPQLLIESVGGVNVFAHLPGNWAEVSLEHVVGTNPDVIVVADSVGNTAQARIEQARTDPALSQLRAVRENRFIVIPFSETTSGVRLLDGARRLADGIRALP
ncbi:ABC transporter substrate-binding protein [Tsukamurella asaccharolytica]|uniref:ABC transporter substrate-binding protein n=1 Tax=Tsukamurella asaccharolytica TaxID=2592067 RepID=A0A5C5RE98_9ACTN|nr:ABC transporter substrate-binding protein [Tsukamurella asaccharolytica]TWS21429.1 ABC transporter substrate-binding protein [Tsukamurella asaccharolytica]